MAQPTPRMPSADAPLAPKEQYVTAENSQNTLDAFHQWYYNTGVWEKVTFLGVPCLKSVMDMWNYQEIIHGLRPSLIIEFGTHSGGSALYFASIGQLVNPALKVLSVDISHDGVVPVVRDNPAIELLTSSSVDARVKVRIQELRAQFPGPVFFILDSNHTEAHVYGELMLLREVTRSGDYVIVEDGNINGHPVLPGWGAGPYEALARYCGEFPDDYQRDTARENKFGFTFAPNGFLIRT